MKRSVPRRPRSDLAVGRPGSAAKSGNACTSLPPPAYGLTIVDDPQPAPTLAAEVVAATMLSAPRGPARLPPPVMTTAPRLQAHLRVGPVHDPHEREADRIADAVLRRSSQPAATRDVPAGLGAAIDPLVQRRGAHAHGCRCGACGVQRHAGHHHDDEDALQLHTSAVQRHAGHHHDDEEDELQLHASAAQRRATPHHDGEQEALQRHAHAPGCACAGCCAVQRHAAGDGGFTADPGLSARVERLSSQGSPLPDRVRETMERSFGADLGGVRVHTDGDAGRLSRELGADAFTHGRHIAFAPGKYDPDSRAGQWLLAHELTHTIQQTGGGGLQRAAEIQRHSTHEHYLLGTLTPNQIALIPKIREQVQIARNKRAPANGSGALLLDEVELDDLAAPQDEDELDLGLDQIEEHSEVLHILRTEMTRLAKWRDRKASDQIVDQEDMTARIGEVVMDKDGHYEVPMVWIPTKGGTGVLCSYAELNTLPDMFGNLKDFEQQPAAVVVKMLQGVRMRSYLELEKIYFEVGGKRSGLGRLPRRPDFKDAIGFTGKNSGVSAVPQYEDATRVGGKFTAANATAALARNACHFAPATWDTWLEYHEAARETALQAHELGLARLADDSLAGPKAEEQAEQEVFLRNRALLLNGFGDHFLQDAFAAGHLIDKTRVMQWFYEWRKTDNVLDTADYHMIGAITRQTLKSNPQQVEDADFLDVTGHLALANIEVEDHIRLLMWWRAKALGDRKQFQTLSAATLVNSKGAPLGEHGPMLAASAMLKQLGAQGFAAVHTNKLGTVTYTLRDQHIDAIDTTKKHRLYDAVRHGDDAEGREKEAEEFYYAAYSKFLNSTYLQLITNFLHDKFCKAGLEVETADGAEIGKIYGDTTMLSAGGQSGVAFSAQTAKWSREAIYDILRTGEAKHTPEQIAARFPRRIEPGWQADSIQPIAIETWWADLKKECIKPGGLFHAGVNRKEATFMKRVKKALAEGDQTLSSLQTLRDAEFPPPAHDDDDAF